jgi:hypothetical protein
VLLGCRTRRSSVKAVVTAKGVATEHLIDTVIRADEGP